MRTRRFSTTPWVALAPLTAALVLLLVVVMTHGHSTASGSPAGGVALNGGVPVGVLHSRAGALAAADNYVALISQSVEQDPRLFAAFVARAYAPAARAGALAQARRLRAGDPRNMGNYAQGGRGVAVVAARRLDAYTRGGARVTTWLGGVVWGPHLEPTQTWNLVSTSLQWRSGRWLVLSCATERTPAPAPAVVYAEEGNNRTPAFARLAGMSAPFYGAAE